MVLRNWFTKPLDRWCFIYEFFQPCPMGLRIGFGRLTDGHIVQYVWLKNCKMGFCLDQVFSYYQAGFNLCF